MTLADPVSPDLKRHLRTLKLGQLLAIALHPGPDAARSDITARRTGVEARRHGRI